MLQQLRKYKDVLNRVVSVFKDTKTGKYTMSIMDGYTFVSWSTTYPNRKSCMEDLKRYPRKTLRKK